MRPDLPLTPCAQLLYRSRLDGSWLEDPEHECQIVWNMEASRLPLLNLEAIMGVFMYDLKSPKRNSKSLDALF